EKYGKAGFVVVSVSLDLANARAVDDDVDVKKVEGKVRAKLKEKKATFGALIVDEDLKLLQAKLHFNAGPCAFVFDRQGQGTQFAGDKGEFNAERIEALVKKLVASP